MKRHLSPPHRTGVSLVRPIGMVAALFIMLNGADAGVTVLDMPAPPARTSFDAWQQGDAEPSADEHAYSPDAGAIALSRYGGQRGRAHSRYFPSPLRRIQQANGAYLYGDAYWYGYGYPYYGTYGFNGYYGVPGGFGCRSVGLSFGVAGTVPAYRTRFSHVRNVTQVRHFR
ncbi:MAG: hypothetical protein KC983_00765 [Phycisphaerales bacterium]|nr:hypothetical protein [Phycisphaerales bacterium]